MFTGLIQTVGKIKRMNKQQHHIKLTVSVEDTDRLNGFKIGDSMAINGVCLTATTVEKDSFSVDVMPATFQKTTFSQMKEGTLVNLERAMSPNDRFEGHIVSGHVDRTTRLIQKMKYENSLKLTFYYPPELQGEIVPQGSIAINGTSLTVDDVKPGTFAVSLIPHSLENTNFDRLVKGDYVNLETDVVGKYVKSLLRTTIHLNEEGYHA
ncbi:riboflavin synthase [Sporolactobacillus sp. STSJ-5]|uniref:riboflavin synthase n=1 Tax=Sporolactobacillus sp. STSJ-5 TaxID=2965076 RepID=UPI0021073F82|nr:riboflavin synthase [Sporolactobacillus sp. STSJ-5]MCQ2010324.1 riboflavin synthase [Sporolactobacillus sp. STSJ-5]